MRRQECGSNAMVTVQMTVEEYLESKLSVAVAAMSGPFGACLEGKKRKKHSVSAVLSCSGTQD